MVHQNLVNFSYKFAPHFPLIYHLLILSINLSFRPFTDYRQKLPEMCPTGTVLHGGATGKPNLRSAFDVLDVDRDGKISRDDLRTSYGGFVGGAGDDVIGTMMTFADANKDGYVEFEEFEKVLDSSRRKNGTVNVMEDVFKVIDKDGDGKVGPEDLKSYLNWAGLHADDDDVKAMIKLGGGDENGGGGVTLQGFLQILSL